MEQPIAGINKAMMLGLQSGKHLVPSCSMYYDKRVSKHFMRALSHLQYKCTGFAFGNDRLGLTYPSNMVVVVMQMQNPVQLWEGLLTAISSTLIPERYFWYLIDFGWQARNWYYKTWTQQQAYLLYAMHNNNDQDSNFWRPIQLWVFGWHQTVT